jgi:hypothetical protein
MHEPATLEHASGQNCLSRGRKRLLLIGLIVLPLVLLVTFFYFLLFWQDIRLRKAIAEADRLDLGWRILEMEAKRAVLPDEQNSALILTAAKKLLPAQWPIWDWPYAAENKGRNSEEIVALKDSWWTLEPPVQLDERQIAALREELARATAALTEARKVADLPHGRYLFRYGLDAVSTCPLHTIQTRSLVNLLAYDCLRRAQEQDMEGALASCRAALNAMRALGDEPLPETIGQRSMLHWVALRMIERTLAQGQPSESSLKAVQELLEDEAAQPLFLIGARAERGLQDSALEALQNGETSINQLWSLLYIGLTPFANGWEEMMMRTESVKVARAALLRFNNELVEIAKRPPEQQRQALRQLAATQSELPRLVRDTPTYAFGRARSYHLDLAWMRSAIVMVAVERYRLAHGRWPESLTDLVPLFLERVPVDPYDGAPLRLGRFPEGVILYSVGEDGQDNGGNLRMPMVAGTDMGWRLWDVPHRRQSAARGSGD